ncbi:MAG: leucine-rich repeat protein, partial [Ruminococcus sp.]|nr:leucine-rich repeat protein [Ruminococcus sp.]
SNAFEGCNSLTSIEIPDSVTNIKTAAFYGCSGLKSVIIPDSVINIGGNAFEDCSSLTSIEIPNSVTLITAYAFAGCDSLTSIKILNPECYIHDISNYDYSYAKTIGDTVTIYGYDNSSAQKYAEDFGNEFISLGKAPTTSKKLEATLFGDANCDGRVTIADATAIIQYLGNEDEYGLSAQGFVNADCYNPGDGVSGKDANAIKMFEAGLIDSFPIIE